MTFFDLALMLIIAAFVFFGLYFGVIHTLGSLIGVVVGAFIASHLSAWLGWIASYVFLWDEKTATFWTFVISFVVINRVVGLLFHIISRVTQILERLPFLNTASKVLGGVLGFVEGLLVMGLILSVAKQYEIGYFWTQMINSSWVALWLVGVATILQPLLPDVMKYAQNLIQKK